MLSTLGIGVMAQLRDRPLSLAAWDIGKVHGCQAGQRESRRRAGGGRDGLVGADDFVFEQAETY